MAEKKQRKPTSTDVAELAGVSQTSVSLVLSGSSRATFSEQTRARVFEAAVLIGEKREELPICSIELSNQRAGAMLADHLYSLGHRHAAFISTPMNQTTLARKQRLEGLRQRFHERGRQDGVETSVEALVAPDSRDKSAVMADKIEYAPQLMIRKSTGPARTSD